MTNKTLPVSIVALTALSSLSQAAMWWETTSFTVDGGATIVEDSTDNVAWPNGSSALFQTVGTGSHIVGSLTAVGTTGGATFAPGADGTIDFEILSTGGNVDFLLGAHPNNPDNFYALNFLTDGDVTSISYKFTYSQPIQGADSGNTVVLVGAFVDVGNAATLTQSITDDSLNDLVLNDGDMWRTNNVGGNTWNMLNPESYSSGGTVAEVGISATQKRALGYVREQSAAGSTQNIGQVYGDLSSNDGNALGAGSQFQFTFNGDFDDTVGQTVVPEPSSSLLLALGLCGFFVRRKR